MVAIFLCAVAVAQMTDQERKAERERVKKEQKLLVEQAKQEKKQKLDAAKAAPTWTVVEGSASDLKGVLIQHMRAIGYSIEDESEHQVTFMRELQGSEAIAPMFALGNAHSEMPRKSIQYTLTPGDTDKTRIDAQGWVSVKSAFGKENRTEITQNPYFKADLIAEYQALKSWADHQKEQASKTP